MKKHLLLQLAAKCHICHVKLEKSCFMYFTKTSSNDENDNENENFQGGSSLPRQLYYYNYILVTSYMFNSVANPLIYVWRLRDFRAYLVNIKEQSLARWRIFQIAEEEQVLERARSTERNQSNIAVSTPLSNIAVSTSLSSIAVSTQLSSIAVSTQLSSIAQTADKHQFTETTPQTAKSIILTAKFAERAQKTDITFQTFQIDQPVSSDKSHTTQKRQSTRTSSHLTLRSETRILTLKSILEET